MVNSMKVLWSSGTASAVSLDFSRERDKEPKFSMVGNDLLPMYRGAEVG